jgi:hypothetical protein
MEDHHMELIMNGEEGRAVAFIVKSPRGRNGRLL